MCLLQENHPSDNAPETLLFIDLSVPGLEGSPGLQGIGQRRANRDNTDSSQVYREEGACIRSEFNLVPIDMAPRCFARPTTIRKQKTSNCSFSLRMLSAWMLKTLAPNLVEQKYGLQKKNRDLDFEDRTPTCG